MVPDWRIELAWRILIEFSQHEKANAVAALSAIVLPFCLFRNKCRARRNCDWEKPFYTYTNFRLEDRAQNHQSSVFIIRMQIQLMSRGKMLIEFVQLKSCPSSWYDETN